MWQSTTVKWSQVPLAHYGFSGQQSSTEAGFLEGVRYWGGQTRWSVGLDASRGTPADPTFNSHHVWSPAWLAFVSEGSTDFPWRQCQQKAFFHRVIQLCAAMWGHFGHLLNHLLWTWPQQAAVAEAALLGRQQAQRGRGFVEERWGFRQGSPQLFSFPKKSKSQWNNDLHRASWYLQLFLCYLGFVIFASPR